MAKKNRKNIKQSLKLMDAKYPQHLYKVMLFQILKDDAVKVLHSICQEMWKTQQWPQDWKRSVFIPIPKKVKSLSRVRLFATHGL